MNFTKEEYLDYTLSCVSPDNRDMMLEVAAGTCVCGRSFAPHVQNVVCLDAALPMLNIGKEKALEKMERVKTLLAGGKEKCL